MRIDAAARTFVGRRKNNEDAYVLKPELGLFAVADGMGGYEGGEVASGLVAAALAELFARSAREDNCVWPFAVDTRLSVEENLVVGAVGLAHAAIHERRQGMLAEMGSSRSF